MRYMDGTPFGDSYMIRVFWHTEPAPILQNVFTDKVADYAIQIASSADHRSFDFGAIEKGSHVHIRDVEDRDFSLRACSNQIGVLEGYYQLQENYAYKVQYLLEDITRTVTLTRDEFESFQIATDNPTVRITNGHPRSGSVGPVVGYFKGSESEGDTEDLQAKPATSAYLIKLEDDWHAEYEFTFNNICNFTSKIRIHMYSIVNAI